MESNNPKNIISSGTNSDQINSEKLKNQIINIGKRLWQKDYVAANDGNISVKLNDNEILATASGVSKGFMNPDMILRLDLDGNLLTEEPKYNPTSEIKMHLEIYYSRSDVRAVVHAHPPFSTAFAVTGISIDSSILPEAILSVGEVPIANYETPSTQEVAESIRPFIEQNNAILLANHGAITCGKSLEDAYFRMETLEHTAKILHNAKLLGTPNLLTNQKVQELLDLSKK